MNILAEREYVTTDGRLVATFYLPTTNGGGLVMCKARLGFLELTAHGNDALEALLLVTMMVRNELQLRGSTRVGGAGLGLPAMESFLRDNDGQAVLDVMDAAFGRKDRT